MSTIRRLISGSASAWGRIFVTAISQVAVVPFFLLKWDLETYGIWITIQAFINVASTLDRGHNDYLEYEFLKAGKENRNLIKANLWSGINVVAVMAIVELLLIAFFLFLLGSHFLAGDTNFISKKLAGEITWSVIIAWITWSLTNITGLFSRCLFTFGYFPRMGWWNVVLAIITAVSPLGALLNNGGLLSATLWCFCFSLIILLFQFIDILRLLKKEQIDRGFAAWKTGFKNYFVSLGLSVRYFLDNFRQQGIRILLAPLSGVTALATFTTMRTGANVALQGLSTITNPMMPELMRFLREKDQNKTAASFDTIWLVVIVVMAPFIIFLQKIMPSAFVAWTQGRVVFNPALFAVLSISVLVYALAQPATAVVIGNNLIRSQVMISIVTTAVLITGLLVLIPVSGIFGAAVSLLAAEISSAILFLLVAKKWLKQNQLQWPQKSFLLACLSIITATTAIAGIICFYSFNTIILVLSFFLLFVIFRLYWRNMPLIAVTKLKLFAAPVTGLLRMFSFKIVARK